MGVLPCVDLRRISGLGESSNECSSEVKRHTGWQRSSVKQRVNEDLGDYGLNGAASHQICLCTVFVQCRDVISESTHSVFPLGSADPVIVNL